MMSKEANLTVDTEPVNTHWVEDLFRPHFCMEDVMKSIEETTKKTQVSKIDSSLPKCLRTSEGNEIYQRVLREKLQREENLLRQNLAKKLAAVPGAASPTKSQPSSTVQSGNKQPEESDCTWNNQDLATLCETLIKTERDQRRLRMQLEQAQAAVRTEREERQRLQGRLDESEQQLGLSRQEAARWALQLDAQQAEGRTKDAQIQAIAAEARQMAEEVARWRTTAREGREKTVEAERKCSDLTWELRRLREHYKVEEERMVEAARLEENVKLQRLTRELEETRAKLEGEKASHAHSQAALELLRKHFTNQSG